MKNNITELVFILDRSGSMSGLESDTIGGFNAMIDKQKKEDGTAYVTTVLFDTRFDRIHDRLPLEEVPVLTEKDYVPGGCTALLDAIGDTVRHIAGIHKYAREEDRPEKTIFIITTDGLENASRRYSLEQVKQLIEHEQEKYGWEFLFLVALEDAGVLQDLLEDQPDLVLRESPRTFSAVKDGAFSARPPSRRALVSASSARRSLPSRIARLSASSSVFRRAGSTARPMTSIRPMFSFLMWWSSACGWKRPSGCSSVVRLLRSTRSSS